MTHEHEIRAMEVAHDRGEIEQPIEDDTRIECDACGTMTEYPQKQVTYSGECVLCPTCAGWEEEDWR